MADNISDKAADIAAKHDLRLLVCFGSYMTECCAEACHRGEDEKYPQGDSGADETTLIVKWAGSQGLADTVSQPIQRWKWLPQVILVHQKVIL
jgi:hypothetical protein